MKKIRWPGCKYFLFSICFLSFVFCLPIDKAEANNLAVSSVSLGNVSLGQVTATVQFNISWDNSWRTTTNYDAAWVFVKYSTNAGVSWNHATLKTSGTNPAGFSQGSGTALDIVVPTDKKGAFLQRSANGAGSVSTSSIQFVWDYGADGVISTSTVWVKVFAIEMVYIPTSAFYVGSGGTETSPFYTYPTTTNAYLISSEAAITVGTGTGNLYYVSGVNIGDALGPIPAVFPKGYAAFYMMKYDTSQGQYADFLNTLTSTQAATRYPGQTLYRHTISGTYPNYSASRPDRACNYLSWADVVAYADWAALRPMTELEFEKTARGVSVPTPNEYAWGNTTITQAIAISGIEDGTETITTVGANCNYGSATFTGGDAGQGPLRCGIFATGSSTRVTSGAGYYGVMDLSGNLWKRPVTVGNTTGRAFTGLHGNGALDGTGNANVTNWPVTDAVGAGLRGGNWYNVATFARTSDRYYAAGTGSSRNFNFGGRCVRTSP
ncbi:MAG: SUMF1/EgtB/PvdO family nonheme iron enzyme [Candidatus Omnitrophica bacterium]|nr:SUMF1/EgtB/PvdO family nonheme iron enzyme [Candidatus Omnitrophota bacterium]MBU4302930.1 SUMF1/EgtB/PvdO family nonheme iron enzyme [Candidatus Omnitrophota bacterium]MBU4467366.1 SUMF1/EgtB/PvdO family nonheme iron enzyme [Candidatus Omnitrophota bacterium]MCG2708459.1 SUMF1/EgtB/PvdO family nonheme iron enzyme [Candidatus Omnitrophota bacterium]